MIVHNNIQKLPAFTNPIITIGTFDGVHTGHRQIIELMKTEASRVHGETIIITFHPHPRMVVSPLQTIPARGDFKLGSSAIYLLNTLEEKIALLQKADIDHLVVVPFTEAFANQTAEEYIKDFLVKTFHPHTIIIGYDHHFGKERKGNYKLLEDKGLELNYKVKEIPVHMLEDVTISSTKIREALLKGDIETANLCLGYAYFFSGKIVEGNKLGRNLGFPTANLQIEDEDKLIPGDGVYAVEVSVRSIQDGAESPSNLPRISFKGMMNIGVRPTVGGSNRVIEVNIFDFEKEIYGETLTVTLKKYLRDEEKFKDLEALKKQLAKDKEDALAALEQG